MHCAPVTLPCCSSAWPLWQGVRLRPRRWPSRDPDPGRRRSRRRLLRHRHGRDPGVVRRDAVDRADRRRGPDRGARPHAALHRRQRRRARGPEPPHDPVLRLRRERRDTRPSRRHDRGPPSRRAHDRGRRARRGRRDAVRRDGLRGRSALPLVPRRDVVGRPARRTGDLRRRQEAVERVGRRRLRGPARPAGGRGLGAGGFVFAAEALVAPRPQRASRRGAGRIRRWEPHRFAARSRSQPRPRAARRARDAARGAVEARLPGGAARRRRHAAQRPGGPHARIYDAASGGSLVYKQVFLGVPLTDGVFEREPRTHRQRDRHARESAHHDAHRRVRHGRRRERHRPLPRDHRRRRGALGRTQILTAPFALRAATADSVATTGTVGGVPAAFVEQLYQYGNADDQGPSNSDPREGVADVDGDGLANLIDADNDGDGILDGSEPRARQGHESRDPQRRRLHSAERLRPRREHDHGDGRRVPPGPRRQRGRPDADALGRHPDELPDRRGSADRRREGVRRDQPQWRGEHRDAELHLHPRPARARGAGGRRRPAPPRRAERPAPRALGRRRVRRDAEQPGRRAEHGGQLRERGRGRADRRGLRREWPSRGSALPQHGDRHLQRRGSPPISTATSSSRQGRSPPFSRAASPAAVPGAPRLYSPTSSGMRPGGWSSDTWCAAAPGRGSSPPTTATATATSPTRTRRCRSPPPPPCRRRPRAAWPSTPPAAWPWPGSRPAGRTPSPSSSTTATPTATSPTRTSRCCSRRRPSPHRRASAWPSTLRTAWPSSSTIRAS
ncbi:MAG: hypothetical protein MZV70_45395 [Desulfobacterales bacterium]|nr:hypothetical protein [Desulfobacterales bacterium]